MKSSFQTILIVICGFAALVAVLMFAGILPSFSGSSFGGQTVEEVVMWGPYRGVDVETYFNNFNETNKAVVKIKYEAQVPETYLNNLVEAFARGEGPDLFFADQKMLNRLTGKLTEIPYTAYSQRTALNNFVDGASVFMTSTGLKALPLMIDPLVMFYNRTLYTSANIVIPPKNWTEFLTTIKPLTEIDIRNNIIRSAAALGEFRNITNAKYIFSTLLLQAGNPIITTDANDNYNSVLTDSFGFTPSPAEATIAFYQQFANPVQVSYSWNRSLSGDKDMFTAEKLATYFGLSSELADLQQKNPHLSLDVVVIPQKDPQKKVTYANFYGAVIAKNSKKQNSALSAASLLSQPVNLEKLAKILNYLPARRDLLAVKDSDPLVQVFKNSAVISRSWVDPDNDQTKQIFQQMMENVQTGQIGAADAIMDANSKINRLFNKVTKSSAE
jgi:ABC-type glycerol-3-phosphate transport system substrate-binding protein